MVVVFSNTGGDGIDVFFKMRSDGCGVCSPRKGVVAVVFFQKRTELSVELLQDDE